MLGQRHFRILFWLVMVIATFDSGVGLLAKIDKLGIGSDYRIYLHAAEQLDAGRSAYLAPGFIYAPSGGIPFVEAIGALGLSDPAWSALCMVAAVSTIFLLVAAGVTRSEPRAAALVYGVQFFGLSIGMATITGNNAALLGLIVGLGAAWAILRAEWRPYCLLVVAVGLVKPFWLALLLAPLLGGAPRAALVAGTLSLSIFAVDWVLRPDLWVDFFNATQAIKTEFSYGFSVFSSVLEFFVTQGFRLGPSTGIAVAVHASIILLGAAAFLRAKKHWAGNPRFVALCAFMLAFCAVPAIRSTEGFLIGPVIFLLFLAPVLSGQVRNVPVGILLFSLGIAATVRDFFALFTVAFVSVLLLLAFSKRFESAYANPRRPNKQGPKSSGVVGQGMGR